MGSREPRRFVSAAPPSGSPSAVHREIPAERRLVPSPPAPPTASCHGHLSHLSLTPWCPFLNVYFRDAATRAREAGPGLPSQGHGLARGLVITRPPNNVVMFHSTGSKHEKKKRKIIFLYQIFLCFFGISFFRPCPLKVLKFMSFPMKGSN